MREKTKAGSKRRCVVKICTTHGIRQIADNSANRRRGSSSEPVFAQDENIRRALSLMCAKSDPIHNIDNDKYAEINFILRNFFLLRTMRRVRKTLSLITENYGKFWWRKKKKTSRDL